MLHAARRAQSHGATKETSSRSRRAESLSDEALLSGLAVGQVDWLGVLYDRHAPTAMGLASRITGDPTLAEDVLQVAFVSVWASCGQYTSARGTGRTWILAVVRNRAIDAVRARSVRERLAIAEEREAERADPEDVALRREASGAVTGALRSLPSELRQVVGLAYFGGLTQLEIARATGLPLGTVKSRTSRALRRLRDVLDD